MCILFQWSRNGVRHELADDNDSLYSRCMKKHFSWKVLSGIVLLTLFGGFLVIRLTERLDWHYNDRTYLWEPPLFKKVASCPSPLLRMSPFDTDLATGILYPGQYRGTDYKPHGGVGFIRNEIDVKLPLDAHLIGGAQYTEQGDLQYILDFQNDCGIRFRFDHLLTLSPEFQKIADTLPPPKPSDTRGVRLKSDILPTGTVVATAVGVPSMQNSGVDFGLYDMRTQNAIAKNIQWRSLHADELEHAAYAVCWFTLLPERDATNISKLEQQYGKDYPVERAVSDYCPAPGGTTLGQNNGLPPREEATH